MSFSGERDDFEFTTLLLGHGVESSRPGDVIWSVTDEDMVMLGVFRTKKDAEQGLETTTENVAKECGVSIDDITDSEYYFDEVRVV